MARPIDWRFNLAVVWLAQFVSFAAFSCSIPFVPLYIKSSGMAPPGEAQFWGSVFSAAASLGLMVMSPVWGALGDRYGRKAMLVRATVGGAVFLTLMGYAGSIHMLVALRLVQGAFTGTNPASQALVSSTSPPHRQSFSLGALAAALTAGDLMGKWAGGEIAWRLGPQAAFKVSGALLLASSLIVVFGARENFTKPVPPPVPDPDPDRPPPSAAGAAGGDRATGKGAAARAVLPLMLVITAVAFANSFDGPTLPLFVEEVGVGPGAESGPDADLARAAYRPTSYLMAVQGLGAILGALAAGWRMDRGRWGRFLALQALGAAVGTGLTAGGQTLAQLMAARSLVGFCESALMSATVIWLGRVTRPESRGTVFGWSVTARAVGWMAAPLASTRAAHFAGFGYHPVFWAGAGCFALLAVTLALMAREKRPAGGP